MAGVDRFRGCLLAGAVGDALGAGVEFDDIDVIRQRHGPAGLTDLVECYGRRGAITDDTQMTLFTAEGLIRASVQARATGTSHPPSVVHHAYHRWYLTQTGEWLGVYGDGEASVDGWLIGERFLHHDRAPGATCMSALASGWMGERDSPLNDSKGCGGVMRAAPAGLMAASVEDAFSLGCDIAALTHGHPAGWLPAGALAAMVRAALIEPDLPAAVSTGMELLRAHDATGVAYEPVQAGVDLAARGLPSPEELEGLGGGWTGEEALAIAVCCALAAGDDLRAGLLAAVNHSGDSDSTGAICGNLLGAALGAAAVPGEWLADVEGRAVIEALADDLWREATGQAPAVGSPEFAEWVMRYPGW